ncbi:putative rRNA biogenesis protein RRP5 [Aspergillus stella-maris]|uniref:putative rRNA biogenesis protein RRP5 n=1 Tax=Aspergillus stella-maris TaxID=1810926 RepID=UPI003CCD5D1F
MAPIKRKGNAAEEASARNPQKRVRVGSDEGKKDGKSSSAGSAPKASELTVLRDDEPSFPRGGGSVLTPLERKQIQIKATKDVLFEQKSGAKRSHKGPDDEGFEEDTDMEDADGEMSAAPSKKTQKGKGKGKKDAKQEKRAKQGVKIEGLSFKRLVPGTLILGQVSSINAHDIGLSLPNNLTGYVPLTAISKTLETKIEKMLEEADEEEDSDDDDDDDFDLNQHFYLGQYLRAYVVSVGNKSADASSKSKKRIELSIDPRSANSGLQKTDLVVDTAVQASVVSVEDHGLVMDLGVEGSDIRGFMSSKEIDPRTDISSIKEGSVFLCMITGQNASGNVIKLSADLQSSGSIKKSHFLSVAPTINSFIPGSAAEILLTEVSSAGMMGKIMGMLDTTVDLVHSGGATGKTDLTKKYNIGAKIKGRISCTFPGSEPYKIGFSMLDHVQKFKTQGHGLDSSDDAPAISAVVPEVTVVNVDPGLGVYVQIGSTKHMGFVHVSRLADGQVETITSDHGPFKIGSTHEARVVGYSGLDNLYSLSFEKKVIDQPFLRLEDVTLGAVVKVTITKVLIGESGVTGLIVSLTDNITGYIPSVHFADTRLQFPEKKFREGATITARILSVNLEKREVRLTLKKSLLNSEAAVWKDYREILPGSQSPGTIVNLLPNGAVVQFYGSVRGWLSVSEMSEAYIKDPSQHFKLGQVVNVHALNVDAAQGKLSVSCRDPTSLAEGYRTSFETVRPGQSVTGTVFEKSDEYVLLKLDDLGGLVARLSIDQIADGSHSKRISTLSKVRVGQKLNELLVLDIHRAHRLIHVTSRSSLRKATKVGKMPSTFEEIQEGAEVTGFVRNITPIGLFIQFLGGLTGLVPKRLIGLDDLSKPEFGKVKFQVVSATVHSIDTDFRRFILSMDPIESTQGGPKKGAKESAKESAAASEETLANPVDETLTTKSDITVGRVLKCKINSVKGTQINVRLADNVQGRIDISEVFDSWEDIKDRKQPLNSFHPGQVVTAKVLGMHDARSYTFLPISHRTGKFNVYELSMKPSFVKSDNAAPLTVEQVQAGSSSFGFVNNVGNDFFWVSLSPNVRGRLRFIDASDDLSLLADVQKHFPVGCAVKFHVTAVDAAKGHIDLSARESSDSLTLDELSVGMVLPTRVTRVTERQLIMQLNNTLVGAVDLINMADDFSKADPNTYQKNEVVRSCVIGVDRANKKIHLSLRPSKVLSSSLPVQDPEITSLKQVKVNSVIRGFVRRVTDGGLFVTVGHDVVAYVRISDLSDSYLKEWKDSFQVGQLVKGRVTVRDPEHKKLQISLKDSVLDPNYKAPITLNDLKPGQIVTGKVRKVEQFGAFIVVDGSSNVSGLCHRTEMADNRVEDAKTLYDEGDAVKAKVLKVDREEGKISFGLKASYFNDNAEDEDSEDEDVDSEGVSLDGLGGVELEGFDGSDEEDDSDVSMGGVDLEDGSGSDDESEDGSEESDEEPTTEKRKGGLGAVGFDWDGNAQDEDEAMNSDSDDEGKSTQKKRKHRKPEIQVDRTGELDANGPQSVADYERLLLGEPDSSLLWLKYMAFQLELGEVEKAREIAERALRTITIGQDAEKLNIWVAMLNLENTYGDDDSLEEVFKRACQYNDTQEIYERLTSIYIQSGKNEKADDLFRMALKKKVFPSSPKFFINYATFLYDTMAAPERGRGLLSRALQSLPKHTHVETTTKFAQLEFRSPNGDIERGRTVFEGLLSSFPKRVDLWNVLLDLEIKNGDAEQVRRLFERVLGIRDGKKGAALVIDEGKKLKPKQARFFFKKWLEYEEKSGDEKSVEETKAKAAEYVKSLQQE